MGMRRIILRARRICLGPHTHARTVDGGDLSLCFHTSSFFIFWKISQFCQRCSRCRQRSRESFHFFSFWIHPLRCLYTILFYLSPPLKKKLTAKGKKGSLS